MAIRKELTLRLQNSPGALNRVCQILCDECVNVTALSVETGGMLRMVVDNPLRAAGALESRKYTVQQREILFLELPHKPGALEHATRMLANADVNIEYTYASGLENQPRVAVVVGEENAARAANATGM